MRAAASITVRRYPMMMDLQQIPLDLGQCATPILYAITKPLSRSDPSVAIGMARGLDKISQRRDARSLAPASEDTGSDVSYESEPGDADACCAYTLRVGKLRVPVPAEPKTKA